MKAVISWQGKMGFKTQVRNHTFSMDVSEAQGGDNAGPSPKEFLVAAIAGCTGMDVVALLKKDQNLLQALEVSADVDVTTTHPKVFSAVRLVFRAKANGLDPQKLMDVIALSQSKYCGVSAMVATVAQITYEVYLNEAKIGQGEAKFPTAH